MKNYIKKALIVGAFFASIFIMESFAKVHPVESKRDFEQRVAEKGLCVALFCDNDDKKKSQSREKNKQLRQMFQDVSSQKVYDDADVIFIRVNTARKEFNGLVDQYGVATVPSFILFNNGQRMMDDRGNPLVLEGFVTRGDLEAFIDTYCGKKINKLNVVKEDTKKRRLDDEKKSWELYFYPRDMVVSDYDPAERDME